MLVTYTAPNRSSHYIYATALEQAGCLRAFVCGFSRFSGRAALPEVGAKLVRADEVQNLYLASLRLRAPEAVSGEMAYLSKVWLDRCSEKPARASDIFLFYSGAGLSTATRLKSHGLLNVVEAVNTHVLVQERILREEHARAGVPFRPFHRRETARRVREYEIADAILCPSRFVRDSFLAQGVPAERLYVVPYGASFDKVATPKSGGDDRFRILYVGQIDIRKGLRYLLEAFAQLRHPAKELWLVGRPTHQTGLEGMAIPEGVRFLGTLKGEELLRAYREADVFALPTVEEGLAHVLGEALSFGLPIVTTAQSGGEDLFDEGREGYFVPARSPEALADKLQLLADDRDLRARMAAAARLRATQLGGWGESGRLLVAALRDLLARRK
jgi:glycosyltransferase involved in cell wall biosynthesis